MRFCICLGLVAVVNLAALSSNAAPITRFVTQSGGTARNDTFGQAGFAFVIPVSPGSVTINRFGYWDQDSNGLGAAHDVGLYHYNGSTFDLIAKATVPTGSGGILDNGYRWTSLTSPITLTDTNQTVSTYLLLASHDASDTWHNGGVSVVTPSFGTVDLGLGVHQSAAMGSVGGPGISVNIAGAPFGGPNMGFEAVPEPTSLALFAFGAAFFMIVRRFRHEK